MIINFNSRDSFYKTPFGAVKTDEEICFSITAQDGVYIDSIDIVVIKNDTVYSKQSFSYNGFNNSLHNYILKTSFSEAGIFRYYFVISSENGAIFGQNENGKLVLTENSPKAWQLTVYDKNFVTPDWAKGKIMYQIFPDRFKKGGNTPLPKTKNKRTLHECWDDIPEFIYDNPSYTANDFYGGNFKGIEEQLTYIKELGADIIYLNPIFESGANHRYSTADYKNADPYLGTNEDFSRLCKKADELGIKIILDGVFSHTGDDSIYFNKFGNYPEAGAFESVNSPYRSWYNFKKNSDEYECWWGFENLPNVNELDPSYLHFITNEKDGVLKFWNDLGAYGWRLDVADELPDEFIDKLRLSVKAQNPDALIIGEVWEDATTKESYGKKRRYLLGNQLDTVMNYPFLNAILNFAMGGSGYNFENSVMEIAENYPAPSLHLLMNSITTHDTVRAITVLNNKNVAPENQGSYKMTKEEYNSAKKKLIFSVFLQFSLPGIPTVYYGDEVGVQGFRDPYNRTTYPYGKEDSEILDFHKKMANLRKNYQKDFMSEIEFLYSDETSVCFRRKNLIFTANNGNAKFLQIKSLKKLVFGSKSAVFNEYGVILPPYSFNIFERKN